MVLWQDLYRILTEPEMNMIKQQQLLMKTEGIELIFTDEAIEELAGVAAEVNRSVENIGARRLHAVCSICFHCSLFHEGQWAVVIERVVEEISFHAPERTGETFTIDKEVSEPKLEACLVNYRLWNAMCKGIVTQ
jgi:ATP-dependent HslUV protease ATP-binding subunit HslU